MNNKIIIGIAVAVFILMVIIFVARPAPSDNNNNSSANVSSALGALIAEETDFDFGTISMAAGNVKRSFKIKNSSAELITIGKIYTSCMCTAASLIRGEKRFGPYGMLGHGFIPSIGEQLQANEEAVVEVVFDPTAHGPAGVGKIQRTITIESNGQPLVLQISALVTP